MHRSTLAWAPIAFSLFALTGCPKDDKPNGQPPPPPPPTVSSAAAGACASGGGTLADPVSAPFFSRSVAGYCVDPQGEMKTYGDKGKFTMEEVCTTAFDGECEVYKRFGLKRVVAFHYVDGAGKGGTAEVILSQFADVDGAYGMFTMRVVAGDPVEASAPRVLAAGGAGAIGTGRAYVWKGAYLVELQYNNDQESPTALAKSSEAILSALGRDVGLKLPGGVDKPAAAKALPESRLIPNGIQFFPNDPLGFPNVGAGALGYYKDGDKRWRMLAIAKADPDQAKDVMKTIRARPGALPVSGVGDEAVHVVVQGPGDSPKVEYLVARRGPLVAGVGDEEYLLRGEHGAEKIAALRVSKDDAIAKVKAWLAAPSAPTASSAPVAAPSAPPSSPKK